jgi:hypothetical protein
VSERPTGPAVCPRCAALVDRESYMLHVEWHEALLVDLEAALDGPQTTQDR